MALFPAHLKIRMRAPLLPTVQSSDTAANIWQKSLIISAIILVFLVIMGKFSASEVMVQYFLGSQDLPVIMVAVLSLIIFSHQSARSWSRLDFPAVTFKRLAILGLLLFAAGWLGHNFLLHGYHFSRDEQMAAFDAEMFRNFSLIVKLPDYWKPFHESLNALFMPESVLGHAQLSSYRPINAMLIACLGAASSPLMTVIGLFATWRIAVRLWPQNTEAHIVTVLFYATSTQVVALAMTHYAMAGHLGLNMLWLWLFLHNRWYSHIAAIGIGFLATGLHQLVYHPLFAGPILALLLWQRRWLLSALYALSYAAIIMCWALYMKLPISLAEIPLLVDRDTDNFILTRLYWALSTISWEYLWVQSANLVRYFAWQHILLLPLLLIGGRAAIQSRDPLRMALLAAFLVTIIVKLILRPYQGHGWGYRYMHGLLGIGCLLAAMGWVELRRLGLANMRQLKQGTAITLCLTMPWLLWQASSFSGAYAEVDGRINAMPHDIVVIDDLAGPFSRDFIINDPYLKRRPLRLMASTLSTGQLEKLCRDYSVGFLGLENYGPIIKAFDWSTGSEAPQMAALKQAATHYHCR